MIRHTHVVLMSVMMTLAACSGSQVRPDSAPVAVVEGSGPVAEESTEIRMDPMLIRATVDDNGRVSSQTYEIPQLFAEANDYLEAGDHANALRLYDMILDSTTADNWRQVTLYNSSLALEGLGDIRNAQRQYEVLVQDWPHSEDARWACFRLAEIAAMEGRYADVIPWMDHVLAYTQIPVADRVEAHIRTGFARLEQRQFSQAVNQFQAGLTFNEQASGWEPGQSASLRPLAATDEWVAQAHYGLGRVYHLLFSQIRLVLPREQLERDLVDKGQLLETAEANYLNSVRTGHPYWGPAAGYMVGQMYEGFYFDILATEVEPQFNELEVEVYFELIRESIRPAIDRAISIYESNLAMAYRMGASHEWVDSTISRIQFLQDYVHNQTGWAQEQQLIVEQRHPHSARLGEGMQFRSEQASSRQIAD
jgi:tetratricopeptide (TPR) repeat protein